MSRNELVNAYIDGQISRRTFVRRLVAAGVSLGAAMSYAHLLAAEKASALVPGGFQFYDPEDCTFYGDDSEPYLSVDLPAQGRRRIARTRRVNTEFEVREPARVKLIVKVRDRGKLKKIGQRQVDCLNGGEFSRTVPISLKGKRILKRKSKANLLLVVRMEDRCHNKTSGEANRKVS